MSHYPDFNHADLGCIVGDLDTELSSYYSYWRRISRKTEMKAETRLMSALFVRQIGDEDLVHEIDGVSLADAIDSVLNTLASVERAPAVAAKGKRVLWLRFGFVDGRCRTLEEVGREFNVSRERIRQIEEKALRWLRHPSRSGRLKPYIRSETGESEGKP